MKLKHACVDAGQYGVNVSPDEYRSDGVRMIRTSDLANGALTSAEDGVYLDGPVPDMQVLRADDLLLSRAGTIGRSYLTPDAAKGMTFAGFLVRFRPRPSSDPRFLSYAIQSSHVQQQIEAQAVTSTISNFNADRYANLDLPDMAQDEQRRVADFLDDRVSRIDRIIAARREQAGKVDEWLNSSAWELLDATDQHHGAPLSARAQIIDTEHKTAPSDPAGGYWIAGTNAIRDGHIVRRNLRETDRASFTEWTKRGRPAPGDVLLTREAPVGEVALLEEGDRRVAIGQRVVLLKPDHRRLLPGYLRLLLMVGPVVRVIDEASEGSLHPHLNMSDISRLRIPDVDVGEQASLALQHEELLAARANRSAELARSIELLTEYKSSLITAAVTGELDVSTAGSSIPG